MSKLTSTDLFGVLRTTPQKANFGIYLEKKFTDTAATKRMPEASPHHPRAQGLGGTHLGVGLQGEGHVAGEEQQHRGGAEQPVLEHRVGVALQHEHPHRELAEDLPQRCDARAAGGVDVDEGPVADGLRGRRGRSRRSYQAGASPSSGPRWLRVSLQQHCRWYSGRAPTRRPHPGTAVEGRGSHLNGGLANDRIGHAHVPADGDDVLRQTSPARA